MKNIISEKPQSGAIRSTLVPLYALALALAITTSNAQAKVPKTHTSCMPQQQSLTYFCKVNLSLQSTPVDNAGITVTAGMPSMPMAHNMRPIKAMPVADVMGQYEFVLELEMAGDWRLVYNISSPFIDRLHEPLVIQTNGNAEKL